MKYLKRAVFLSILAGALGAVGWFAWQFASHRAAVTALVERTKADLVYVEGGTFEAGNYQVDIRVPDGGVERRWMYETQLTRPPNTVTLASFYISADEASAEDHAVFLADQDLYPPLRDKIVRADGSAAMEWAEARDYCAWLGQLTGIPLRLPTENEWEYAARSGGAKVPFATDDGEFRWGVNVQDNDRDAPKLPLRSFPPNPLGLRDVVEGAYEWVSDRALEDPEDVHIAKGSSSRSSSFYETIPTRYDVGPLNPEQISLLAKYDKRLAALAELGPVYSLHATARCVAPVTEPPEVSGFGRPGGKFDPVPSVFGPYGARNELIE